MFALIKKIEKEIGVSKIKEKFKEMEISQFNNLKFGSDSE